MAISPRFPAPRGGGGSEGVETVSRGPRVDSNLPPPFYPPLRSNVRADSKPSNEMALAAKRILVTDTGNGRGRRPFPSHARPSMRIYIYIYIVVQLPRFLFPDSPITSSFYFSFPSPPLFLLHRVEKSWSNAFPSKYLPILPGVELFSLFVRRETYVDGTDEIRALAEEVDS